MFTIDPRFRPEKCASKDETRPQLAAPYLDADRRLLVATDGRTLVALPVVVEPGEKSRHVGAAELEAKRRATNEAAGQFPDWPTALPKFQEGDPDTATVALDAKLLLQIARALGAHEDRVVLSFRIQDGKGDESSMWVRRLSSEPSPDIAALMPCHLVNFPVKREIPAPAPTPDPKPEGT